MDFQLQVQISTEDFNQAKKMFVEGTTRAERGPVATARESAVILILELYAFYADLIRRKLKMYESLTDIQKERKEAQDSLLEPSI